MPNKPVGWEGIACSCMAGATPGAGRTGAKKEPAVSRLLKQGRRLGSLRLLHGFGLGLRNGFLRGLCLRFGGELLLDLSGDNVGVHFVDRCGFTEHLWSVAVGG